MNNKIEQYLINQSKALNIEFEKIKILYKDSDVKGGQNEKIIAEFIKKNFNSNFISIGVEIIDSYGNHTDEIDIAVSNEHQPFSAEYGQPLIAEGIDFVVQVKKTITTQEVPRIIKNCERLKKIIRKSNNNDKTYALLEDIEYYINRIPYIVIASESQLTLQKIIQQLNEHYQNSNYELQPDIIFVLNRGFIINFREGKGKSWLYNGEKMKGFCSVNSEDKTLFEFIRYIHSYIPKIDKVIHPLNNYFTEKIYYTVNNQ